MLVPCGWWPPTYSVLRRVRGLFSRLHTKVIQGAGFQKSILKIVLVIIESSYVLSVDKLQGCSNDVILLGQLTILISRNEDFSKKYLLNLGKIATKLFTFFLENKAKLVSFQNPGQPIGWLLWPLTIVRRRRCKSGIDPILLNLKANIHTPFGLEWTC